MSGRCPINLAHKPSFPWDPMASIAQSRCPLLSTRSRCGSSGPCRRPNVKASHPERIIFLALERPGRSPNSSQRRSFRTVEAEGTVGRNFTPGRSRLSLFGVERRLPGCVSRKGKRVQQETNLPGQKSEPRSLDSRGDGNWNSEAYRQGLPRGGYESPGRNKGERVVASKMSIPEGRAYNWRAKAA